MSSVQKSIILSFAFLVGLSVALPGNRVRSVRYQGVGRARALASNPKTQNDGSETISASYQLGFIKVPKMEFAAVSDALVPLVVSNSLVNLPQLAGPQDSTHTWAMLLCSAARVDAVKLTLRDLLRDDAVVEFSPTTLEAYGRIRRLARGGYGFLAEIRNALLDPRLAPSDEPGRYMFDLGSCDDNQTDFNIYGQVGKVLTFDIWSQGGTGYSWTVDAVETTTPALSVESFIEIPTKWNPSPDTPVLVGAKWRQRLQVMPEVPGPAQLVLQYVRPWETHNKPQQRKQVLKERIYDLGGADSADASTKTVHIFVTA